MFAVPELVFRATWLLVEHAPPASAINTGFACFAGDGPLACPWAVGLVGSYGGP